MIEDEVNSTWVWDHEIDMKNALLYKTFPALDSDRQAMEGDVIVVSDVDEIPKPETMTLLRYVYPHNYTESRPPKDVILMLWKAFANPFTHHF